MKKQILKSLLTIACLLYSIGVYAHDFEVDGIYYYKLSSTEVKVTFRGDYYYSYTNEYTGSVVIPERVTYKGVTYSVTSIGSYAFCECDGLKEITIPNSVTSINEYAFCNCSRLTEIRVKATNPPTVEKDAFFGVDKSIPVFVPTGSVEAYKSQNGWNEFSLITDNELIGKSFENKNILYQITADDEVAVIYNNYSDSVVIPESVIYESIVYSVTSIGDNAFWVCRGLTSVTIPNSVTSIGSSAFQSCTGLTEITIPNSVTLIGSSAFNSCTGLTEITIPNSVTSIGGGAFSSCKGLTSVTISNGVTSIGSSAFQSCTRLTSITIPNSVTSIGDYAFSYCTGLTEISIPNSVTSIGGAAFQGCTGLTEISIPNSVTEIGSSTFRDCTGLSSVTIPESVTKIGTNAFKGCTGITMICIAAKNPPTLDASAFESSVYNALLYVPKGCIEAYQMANGWLNFRNIVESGNLEVGVRITVGGIIFEVTAENEVAVTNSVDDFVTIYTGNVTIPETITCAGTTYSVTSIGKEAFRWCYELTSVTIPKSVTSIGESAFYSCMGLTKIHVKATNPPTVEYNAFTNVDKSIPVIVPTESVEAYKSQYGWSEFNAITDKEFTVKSFEKNNILYRTIAEDEVAVIDINENYSYSIVIPESVSYEGIAYSVTSIGKEAFFLCSGLTSVTIPNSVTSICEAAFVGCNSLTEITIPNSVTSIGKWAFNSCSGLTEITIPHSVTSIGVAAFVYCT